jgi:hypothetical protein
MSARSQVVGALVGSDEYLGDLLDNPNNNTGYYPQVLGRTASAGEVAGWIGVLRQPSPGPGQPNRNEQVLITIVSSPEYFNSQRDPVDPTLTSSRGWLNGLFTNPLVLGRAAGTVTSDAGFNSLLNSLLGDYQPLRVADVTNFVTSGEFRGNLVAADYVAYLHRAASSGDVSQWTGQLNSGLSDEALIQILVSSQEYFNFAQNNAPPFYRNDPNSKYVAQLYQDLLHRPADAGAAFWVNALDAGSMNRSQVAGALLGSSEYLSGVVAGFYNKYLHRNPDNNGFVNAMQHGLRDEQVIEAIVGSSEYFLEAHAVS